MIQGAFHRGLLLFSVAAKQPCGSARRSASRPSRCKRACAFSMASLGLSNRPNPPPPPQRPRAARCRSPEADFVLGENALLAKIQPLQHSPGEVASYPSLPTSFLGTLPNSRRPLPSIGTRTTLCSRWRSSHCGCTQVCTPIEPGDLGKLGPYRIIKQLGLEGRGRARIQLSTHSKQSRQSDWSCW